MKRFLCLMICAALILAALPALAAGLSEVMCVTNCQEWVSLREEPSTSSRRLAKVYLGELVTGCAAAENGFILCDYGGKTGYILGQYLKTTSYSSLDDVLPNQMVINVLDAAPMLNRASSSGRQLCLVPAGDVVTSCVGSGSYVYCEYQGYRGYISKSYLYRANYDIHQRSQTVVSKYEGLYPPITGPMEVVNCEEWVSLREKASASSARLMRVPLGARVESCLQVSDTFVYCTYGGLWGYVQLAYLSQSGAGHTPPAAARAFDRLTAGMTYDAFSSLGETVTEFWSDPEQTWLVSVRRDTSGAGEDMCAAVFGHDRKLTAWMRTELGELSELSGMDAFPGGTDEEHTLMWWDGWSLSSYLVNDQLYDNQLWSIPLEGIGGTVHEVDTDGTVYLTGYYAGEITCVSPGGQVLWQAAQSDPDVYWPYQIDINGSRIDVHYEGGQGETVQSYSKADGSLLSSVPAETSAPAASSAAVVLAQWAEDTSYTNYLEFIASRDVPQARVVYSALGGSVRSFQVLRVSLDEFRADGSVAVSCEVLYTLPELTEANPLMVTLTFDGDMPNNGFAYTDAAGRTHRFVLEMSGEDGSLFFWEF